MFFYLSSMTISLSSNPIGGGGGGVVNSLLSFIYVIL
jgi:hypothetical protein